MSLIFNYIGKMSIYIIPTLIIYILIKYKSFKGISKDNILPEIAKCLLLLWSVGLLGVTLFPDINVHIISGSPILNIRFPSGISWEISPDGIENISSIAIRTGGVNLIPFATIRAFFAVKAPSNIAQGDWILVRTINLLGNVALFVPLGFLFPFINKKNRLLKTFGTFAVCICVLEFLQRFTGRACDIDDFILNISGVLIGYVFYKLLSLILKKLIKQ